MARAEERGWRDAKIPKWVAESVDAEMRQWRLTAALSWPTEAKPEPVSFRWGDYDRLTGTPVPGRYWRLSCEGFEIRPADEGDTGWVKWRFKSEHSQGWSTSKPRGPIYANLRDARLALLWAECEMAAGRLEKLRRAIAEPSE